MPQSSRRSWIGIAPTAADATLSATYASGTTSIVLNNIRTWTTAPATSQYIVIVDGNNTEELGPITYTAGTVTGVTTANAHNANCYVYFQAASAPSPAYVPVEKIATEDDINMLKDNAFRGSQGMTAGVQEGMRIAKLSFDGSVFPDTFGYWLQSLNGYFSGAATSGSTPATYTFSVANTTPTNTPGQPAPFLIYDYNPASSTTRVFPRAIVSDLTVKVDPGAFVNYTVNVTSQASGIVTSPSTIPPSFSTVIPLVSRLATVSIGGSPSYKMETGEFAWKREQFGEVNTLAGIQDPLAIFAGALSSTIKLSAVAADDTELNYYLNGTQNGITVTCNGTGTLQNSTSFAAQYTKVNYDKAVVDKNAKAWVTVALDASAIINSTDGTPAGGLAPTKFTLTTGTAGTSTQYGAT